MITKSTGIITTVAGTGGSGYTGDGGLATAATFYQPYSLAIDSLTGNIFIADTGNNVIRLITKSTGIITTVLGRGQNGPSGSGLNQLFKPNGICLDNMLRILYIADTSNSRVLSMNLNTAVVSMVAGNNTSGFYGDGGNAKVASLQNPSGIAVDPASGNIYIADNYNNRVRMISKSSGIISTVAGTGNPGSGGDGKPAINATLNFPFSLTVNPSTGNVYVATYNRVRMINIKSGRISTVAGTIDTGYNGDGGLATAAQLFNPCSVALDASGAILIADTFNNRIRSITGTPTASYAPTSSSAPSPNPTFSPSNSFPSTPVSGPTSGTVHAFQILSVDTAITMNA